MGSRPYKSVPRRTILVLLVVTVGAAWVNSEDGRAKPAVSGVATPIKRDRNASIEGRQSSPAPVNAEYVIGPEDLLDVHVWHEPDISGKVPVRPDGKISLPLVGDLQASGSTPTRLQNTIAQKLRAYISDPEVTIVVQQANSQKFNVMGQVQRPGSYPLSRPTRVLDALAIAGGFRDFAKLTKIYVLRRTAQGANMQLPFDYKQVVKGRNAEQNIELEPGDTVVVP